MIKIVMTNGCTVTWCDNEYTDYKYDGNCFLIERNDRVVGFYNIDHVISISINAPDNAPGVGAAAPDDAEPKSRCVEFNAVLSKEEIDSLLKALNDKRCIDCG